MKYGKFLWAALGGVLLTALLACNKEDSPLGEEGPAGESLITLGQVAELLATLPLGQEQMGEVRDAVGTSVANGYDEEYRMQDLFLAPGSGVGEGAGTKASRYSRPLRDLLREAVEAKLSTKSCSICPLVWLDSLAASDAQIYWPQAQDWDGETLPVITYDPADGSVCNEGYELCRDGSVKKVLVDEQMSLERPVWVVNWNADAQYKTLEMLRKEDPEWGQGGELIVKSTDQPQIQSLIVRSFKAFRQFDPWLSGGAEFWIKAGSIEDFTASTEPELRLYEACLTDFMLVVRRNQVEQELPFNAILVSEWGEWLETCALMMVEDDGGTRTTWSAKATVKYNSKSYGAEIEFPLNTRDDIVWRGSLSHAFIEKNSGKTVRFGDVELVLELI